MSDLIKREDAMRVAMWFGRSEKQHPTPFIKKRVMEIPTADRPKGWWSIDSVDEIELSYGGTAYEPVYKCSHCGRTTESYVRFDKPLMPEDADFPNFCGWCGAQMKGADDE